MTQCKPDDDPALRLAGRAAFLVQNAGKLELFSGKEAAMNRRRWLAGLGSLSLWLLSLSRRAGASPMQADFHETLKFGLKCRLPSEFAFVDLVVLKVDQGLLPKDLVLSQFNWSREQSAKIPFPYFQFGMRKRAAALGVDLG
jgi:hypothetical protein